MMQTVGKKTAHPTLLQTYSFQRVDKNMNRPLSNDMKCLLRSMVRGESVSISGATLRGLTIRGFCDQEGSLTLKGWQEAVTMLPLAEQCRLLGVTYEKLAGLSYGKQPELEALRYYATQGYIGAYCEGGPILLLIRSAALDTLAQLNIFGRGDACTRFTEAQLIINRENSNLILNAIRASDVDHVVRHFEEIYTSPMVKEWYPGLNIDTMASLFATIGAERLAQITTVIMEDPSYRAGWPDLTMVNGAEMLWVEVKTTDRLHMSQISTIHRMKPLLPGDVRVVQLV